MLYYIYMSIILDDMECMQATINYAHRLGRKVTRDTHAGDRALCTAQVRKLLNYLKGEYPPITTWRCWSKIIEELE